MIKSTKTKTHNKQHQDTMRKVEGIYFIELPFYDFNY